MEICDNILNSVEFKTIRRYNDIYRQVYMDFCIESGKSFNFWDENASYSSKVWNLLYEYVYESRYAALFFEIMKKYGYNMRQEIKDAMHHLGLLRDPNENSAIINKYINSPVIQDISFDGKSKFTIESERFGKFVFELASSFYGDNERLVNYVKNNKLSNQCHNHTYYLSSIFPNFYAVTSLCKSYFGGNYIHSYTYDKERDLVIDLCSNAVVSKESYYSIFKPREVSSVLNDQVWYELGIVNDKSRQTTNRCYILKIALFKLYLESIKYRGVLEDAPSSYVYTKNNSTNCR